MEKEIQLIEQSIILLADKLESGEWQGVGEEIRNLLGYIPDEPLQKKYQQL